jgi:tetratricopeptide (TPR) repeat protein
VDLHDTDRGRLLQRRTYDGSNVFELVDSISVQLRRDLGIPAGALDLTTDLPSSELFSESPTAYRAFAEGLGFFTQADFQSATAKLESAVAIDSTFAMAQLIRYQTLTALNRAEEGNEAIAAAMEHSYRLTERIQFVARIIYYWLVQQDADRALAVATMWTELYPEEVEGHAQRAQMLVLRGENDAAIGEMHRILELDSTQHNYLQEVAGLHVTQGQYDSALTYYDAYAARLPEDPRAYIARARVRWLQGDFDAAASDYERALVVDPGNVAAFLGLGQVAQERGDFLAAAGHLEEGLAASRTPLRRAEILVELKNLYQRQGQLARAIEYMHESWTVRAPVNGPFQEAQARSQEVTLYAVAGQSERALDSLRAIEERLGEQFGSIASFGYLGIGTELDDIELVEAGVAGVEEFIETFGFESVRFLAHSGRAYAHELRGECQEAIALNERALELQPTSFGLLVYIARCRRKLGDLDGARDALSELVETWPFLAEARLELALVLAEQGRDAEALEHLEVALEVWRDADPEFKWARHARELEERLAADTAP